MFALHYAFRSADAAHALFRNVRETLAPGGRFAAVFPCKDTLVKRVQRQLDAGAPDPFVLRNALYRVEFAPAFRDMKRLHANLFGVAYSF